MQLHDRAFCSSLFSSIVFSLCGLKSPILGTTLDACGSLYASGQQPRSPWCVCSGLEHCCPQGLHSSLQSISYQTQQTDPQLKLLGGVGRVLGLLELQTVSTQIAIVCCKCIKRTQHKELCNCLSSIKVFSSERKEHKKGN